MKKIKLAFLVLKKIKNWPLYFLDYFKLIKNKNIIYVFRDGLKVKLRSGTSDRNVVNDVLIQNFYTPKGFEIKSKDTVIDIGAHIGTFSLFASRFAKSIYAFEPLASNFDILKENIKINGFHNIEAYNVAVADQTGMRDLFVVQGNAAANSLYLETELKTKIKTISLDDIVNQNKILQIDYLKLDCEGAEYDILMKCSSDVLSKIKTIGMECHDIDKSRNLSSIKEFLERKGFRVEVAPWHHKMVYARREV